MTNINIDPLIPTRHAPKHPQLNHTCLLILTTVPHSNATKKMIRSSNRQHLITQSLIPPCPPWHTETDQPAQPAVSSTQSTRANESSKWPKEATCPSIDHPSLLTQSSCAAESRNKNTAWTCHRGGMNEMIALGAMECPKEAIFCEVGFRCCPNRETNDLQQAGARILAPFLLMTAGREFRSAFVGVCLSCVFIPHDYFLFRKKSHSTLCRKITVVAFFLIAVYSIKFPQFVYDDMVQLAFSQSATTCEIHNIGDTQLVRKFTRFRIPYACDVGFLQSAWHKESEWPTALHVRVYLFEAKMADYSPCFYGSFDEGICTSMKKRPQYSTSMISTSSDIVLDSASTSHFL